MHLRRRSIFVLWVFLLCLLCCQHSSIANDDDDGGYGYDDDGLTYVDDAYVADDDTMTTMQLCEDAAVQVISLYMLCDSPGNFYYGSGKYRNSATCRAGDKAKIRLTFNVSQEMDDIDPLLTLKAQGKSESVTIYKNARLCYLGTIKSTSGASCASIGTYQVSSQFYWDKSDEKYNSSAPAFSPFLTVGFHSEKNPDVYDLGGANTDLCEGDTVVTVTTNGADAAGSPFFSFLWSFLILIGTIGILGMFAWWLWRRPGSSADTFSQHYVDSLEDNDRKLGLVASDRGLVDF